MRTKLSENEVARIPIDAITHALSKMPYNGQDELDKELAEHYLLRALSSAVDSRIKKFAASAKEAAAGSDAGVVQISPNFRREISFGSPRMLFDVDTFIDKLLAKYPSLPKHVLRELAADSKKPSAPPTLTSIEYIGDVERS